MKIFDWLDRGDVIQIKYFSLRIYRNQNMPNHYSVVRDGVVIRDKCKGWVLSIIIYKHCFNFLISWII